MIGRYSIRRNIKKDQHHFQKRSYLSTAITTIFCYVILYLSFILGYHFLYKSADFREYKILFNHYLHSKASKEEVVRAISHYTDLEKEHIEDMLLNSVVADILHLKYMNLSQDKIDTILAELYHSELIKEALSAYHNQKTQPYNKVVILHFLVLLIVVTACVLTIAIIHNERNRVNATEFLNLLFSSSLNDSHYFGCIFRYDKSIVYADSKFLDVFSHYLKGVAGIDGFLSCAGLTATNRKNIEQGIKERKSVSAQFSLKKAILEVNKVEFNAYIGCLLEEIERQQIDNVVLHLNYLDRVSDFFYIYVNVDSNVISPFRMLDHLPLAFFNHDPAGEIIERNSYFTNKFGANCQYLSELKNSSEQNSHIESFVFQNQRICYLAKQNGFFDVESLIRMVPVAGIVVKTQGNITARNELFGKLVDEISYDHISQIFEAPIAEQILNGNQYLYGLNTKVTCNNKKYVRLFAHKVIIADLSYFLVCIVDVSEEKKLQSEIARSNKMQAIGQLSGSVAHDFNNILTAIIGFCDLLSFKHSESDASFYEITQIKNNANRAAILVKQLLSLSRKQDIQTEIINMKDVIIDITHMLRRLVDRNVLLSVDYDEEAFLVKADKSELEQVILNLSVNAFHAVKQQGGAVDISVHNIEIDANNQEQFIYDYDPIVIPAGSYVCVEIKDNGTGIKPEIIDKIFDPFFTTKTNGTGTGLGLSTVLGIVKQLNGYIKVHSAPEQGTYFYVFFTRIALMSNRVPKEEKQHIPYSDITGKGKIIFIEDESAIKLFAVKSLTKIGYEVEAFSSAEDALDRINNTSKLLDINLIITDVIMTGMSGIEMIEKITDKNSKIKVIFISGYSDRQLEQFITNNPQYYFLQKPFNLQGLAEKVKEVIAKSEE